MEKEQRLLKKQMEYIYKNTPLSRIPWNCKEPPEILRDLLTKGEIGSGKIIELGCGAGNYVMYLASRGCSVTGVDFSDTAVEIARRTAEERGLDCTFIAADVLGNLEVIKDTFDFVYDWELFHHIFPKGRERYLQNVYNLLKPNGRYVSVFFSEDDPQFGGEGKYRKTPLGTELYFSSEKEVELLYRPLFQIIDLKTIDLEGKKGVHKVIYAFVKK